MKKVTIVLLVGLICLLGTAALAYQEAPMLRTLVAAEELPPIEKRIGLEPYVIEPIETIGQYGDTIYAYSTKTFTFYLRKGIKWSDGVPFTADDISFLYNDMRFNEEYPAFSRIANLTAVTKIDDYTIVYEFSAPNLSIPIQMAWTWGGQYVCSHYLKKFHIDYNPQANELAKKESEELGQSFKDWTDALGYYVDQWNVIYDRPTMAPWILTESTTTIKIRERNPYFFIVDTAGNQLPYIDRVVSPIIDTEVYQLKIISGEADVAYVGTDFANYPLYKENEASGDYRVVLIPGVFGTQQQLPFNLNEPDLVLRELYQDKRFRQGLSVAINREEINEVVYFGLGVPRQATVLPDASYYKEEWGEAYAQYDPDEANRLLDEAGLTERDNDGFRIGPDGKTLLMLVEWCNASGVPVPVMELVKEYWEAVGVKTLLKFEGNKIFWTRRASVEHGIMVEQLDVAEEIENFTAKAVYWRPTLNVAWGHNWAAWLYANDDIKAGEKTLEDFEDGKMPGEEPPEEIKQMHEWIVVERPLTAMGSEEYFEISQKIYDWHAENVIIIGTVGMLPHLYIAKNNVGNAPQAYPMAMSWPASLGMIAYQLFFK